MYFFVMCIDLDFFTCFQVRQACIAVSLHLRPQCPTGAYQINYIRAALQLRNSRQTR